MSALSQPPQVDPATLYNLDFDIVKENWSVYNLEDGNKIRARVMLVSIKGQRVPPQKGDLVAPETSLTLKIDAPPNRRGPKGSPATPEEINDPKNHNGTEVGILNSNEPWNEYHVSNTDIRIRVKLVLNIVWRIKDRFDNLGDPVYVVNFTVVPAITS
jgi:hypothetical protein